MWVGFWGSSISVRVTPSADLKPAECLVWNSEMKNVEIGCFGAVGGVATVGLGMTGKVGPGGGVKTSRLIVSFVILPRDVEFRYFPCRSDSGQPR